MMVIKQHFIPQFILRNFATDQEKSHLNLFLINQERIVSNAKIRNQAERHYLYGKDQKLENSFSTVESSVAPIINKICTGEVNLSKDDESIVKLFIITQLFRTPTMANQLNELTNSVKTIFELDSKFRDILGEANICSDDISISIADPFKFFFSDIKTYFFLILDLHLTVIQSPRTQEFVIGEHPVILLNPYLCEKNYKRSKQALGQKGTVIVMPISPNKAIVLYDKIRYRILRGNPISEDDANNLNYCQFLKTNQCVYLSSFTNLDYLRTFSKKSCLFRMSNKLLQETLEEKKNGEGLLVEKLTRNGTIDLPIKQNFGFIRIFANAYLNDIGADILRETIISHPTQKKGS